MKRILFLCLILVLNFSNAQTLGESVSYRHYKAKSANTLTNFAVQGDLSLLQANRNILYKYQTNGWHFIRCTPTTVARMMETGAIQQLYFDPAQPYQLNDTMRIVQNVDSVHQGSSPLLQAYTGKGVILGYIDSGIDFNHEDFKNEDGTSRVLFYWDHTLAFDAERTPEKYGYGQVWTNSDIDAGICLSGDASAHGTTVAGTGSGNGRATGAHKGVAPETDIIMVESNFGLANWTLTIADAVHFIFSMADSLGKPAVVNASLGTYLGSHDGTDPAAMVIDSLLNDKRGRIMVSAAGNSGNQGKYHLKSAVEADTSFTWFEVNMASGFDVPATYFDLWADTADFKDVWFAFGADKVSPSFNFRGRTEFYNIEAILGTTVFDTIWVGGSAISPVEFTAEEINGVYHLEMAMLDMDSVAYYYRFETTGAGKFDLWSGAWLGGANIVSTGLPSPIEFPSILNYMFPDTLSTTVSSWTCSPNVVTVGNFKNQHDYIDYTGATYVLTGGPAGKLSVNSSKGPNRVGHIKPDVAATGDGIMSACPSWLSASLIVSNPSMMAVGGKHVRNGGTSMASPVIAGIAALYLEKCPTSTYQDFIDDLHSLAYEDMFSVSTPNNAYGYGKVNAFEMLKSTSFDVTIVGDTLICDEPELFNLTEGPFDQYLWYDGSTSTEILVDETAEVFVEVKNEQGCKSHSDTIYVIKGTLPITPLINVIGGGLVATPADSFIWYYNGGSIEGSNSQFYNPDSTGSYMVQVFSPEGCSYFSPEVYVDLSSIHELSQNEFVIFPNPFVDEVRIIKGNYTNVDVIITNISGKIIYQNMDIPDDSLFLTIDLSEIANGVYVLAIFYDSNFSSYKLIKQKQ